MDAWKYTGLKQIKYATQRVCKQLINEISNSIIDIRL